MKLTDSYIKKLKHLDKDQWISHDGVTGLVLGVYKYPSTSKTFSTNTGLKVRTL